MMSIGTGPQPNLAERERKASVVMTIVFFIIGLSVILSYNWGSPTPEFRTDAPNIILFGIVVAANPALPEGPAFRADVVDDGPVSSEIHDLTDLEFLVGRGYYFVGNRPVSLVHGELDPHLVDPLRPDGVDRLRLLSMDTAAFR